MTNNTILNTGKNGYLANSDFEERTERAIKDRKQFQRDALEVASFINDDLPALSKVLSETESYSILDLGCGYGRLAPFLSAFDCLNYLGVERLETRLTHAQSRYSSAIINFILADILHFKTSQKFDVVWSSNVLQHLVMPDKLKLIETMKAAVKASGSIILREAEIISGTKEDAVARYASNKHPWHMVPITFDELANALMPFELRKIGGIVYQCTRSM